MLPKISEVKVETIQSITEWTFVRVYAGDAYGTGEATPAPGLKSMGPSLRKMLLGEDPLKINRIEEKLRHAALFAGTTVFPLISATVAALYDLIGKNLELPVWRLLGGDRDSIRVYADAHAGEGFGATNSLLLPVRLDGDGRGIDDEKSRAGVDPVMGRLARERWSSIFTPDGYAKRAKDLIRKGYGAVKFDLDIPTPHTKQYNLRSGELSLREVDYLAEIVREVRETVGDEVELMIDFHWRYNLNTAVRICRALNAYKLRWFEDLTPAQRSISNLDEIGMLVSRCSAPIATGENLYTVYQFKDLLKTGVSVWTPDIEKAGGIAEARRIAELASMYDIEFSPHNVCSPIGTMASAHACSVSNTFGVLEFHFDDFPLWRRMARSKSALIDRGFIGLGEEPGLGVELDERVMKRNWPDFDL